MGDVKIYNDKLRHIMALDLAGFDIYYYKTFALDQQLIHLNKRMKILETKDNTSFPQSYKLTVRSKERIHPQ